MWDFRFEVIDSYKSSAYDTNESRSRVYGYHTFCGNYKILQQRVCNLNVEDKLNSKRNDINNKSIADSLHIFIDFYSSLDETKMLIAKNILSISCPNIL